MDGKEVFTGHTDKGVTIVIRYPRMKDAEKMQRYINELSNERTFIRMQGEQTTLDEEKEFVKKNLKDINDHKAVMLLVFDRNKLIGISGISLRDKTEFHEGVFGISVAKEYRGKGVGKLLMETILDEAVSHLTNLRIITLSVYDANKMAQKMYQEFGFKIYGRLPEGIYYKGEYIDHLYMYKKVR